MYRDSSSRRIKTQIFLLLLKFYNSGKELEFKTIYQGFTIIEFEQFERLSLTRLQEEQRLSLSLHGLSHIKTDVN